MAENHSGPTQNQVVELHEMYRNEVAMKCHTPYEHITKNLNFEQLLKWVF